jgi:hypothetical protein
MSVGYRGGRLALPCAAGLTKLYPSRMAGPGLVVMFQVPAALSGALTEADGSAATGMHRE